MSYVLKIRQMLSENVKAKRRVVRCNLFLCDSFAHDPQDALVITKMKFPANVHVLSAASNDIVQLGTPAHTSHLVQN
ncbi:hypothetical protein ALC53_11312 [Atta colombica]|uniref:Uncharacterized protein n=1 Tax=Atta colombica TaxID=520822 RepID=A0A151HZL8_9HYME|nr:hypothetical protein ALC53_11312 [Atta colombica]